MSQLNHGTHISNIMERQACKKHRSPMGFPCYEIYSGPDGTKVLPAICNRRAVLAGANGKISQSSYTARNIGSRDRSQAA